MVDFTNCQRVFGKAYSGANGKKIAVEYNERLYMLKFPPSGANRPTDLSYTNSCYSEFIGSNIKEAVIWFKNPDNASVVSALSNKLKNY